MPKLPVEIPEELLRHWHQEFRHNSNSPQSPNVALTVPLLHAGDLQQSIQQALEGSQEIPYATTSQAPCLPGNTDRPAAGMIQSKALKTATRSARRSNQQARQSGMSMRIEPLLYKQEQRPNSTTACTSRMTTTPASSTTTTTQTTTTASQSGRAPARAQGHGMGKRNSSTTTTTRSDCVLE